MIYNVVRLLLVAGLAVIVALALKALSKDIDIMLSINLKIGEELLLMTILAIYGGASIIPGQSLP